MISHPLYKPPFACWFQSCETSDNCLMLLRNTMFITKYRLLFSLRRVKLFLVVAQQVLEMCDTATSLERGFTPSKGIKKVHAECQKCYTYFTWCTLLFTLVIFVQLNQIRSPRQQTLDSMLLGDNMETAECQCKFLSYFLVLCVQNWPGCSWWFGFLSGALFLFRNCFKMA